MNKAFKTKKYKTRYKRALIRKASKATIKRALFKCDVCKDNHAYCYCLAS